MDKDFSLYTSAVRVQQSKVEVIADMDDIVLELLLQFEKTNRVRPVNVSPFRWFVPADRPLDIILPRRR